MRFMIMVKATAQSEAGIMPTDDTVFAAMATYHEELAKAGVLLDASGLQPTSKGWRIRYSAGKRSVVDGPFAETKEQLLGFYVVDCDSLDGALEIAKDLGKANPGGSYEIRPIALFNPAPAGGAGA